ncbi:MAG: hydroxyethylthiazole kinase [Termitinemataceae bacterium]|nr:MAG: hydroxyethylthiazole kinase [Termitinemataceae bacterium]
MIKKFLPLLEAVRGKCPLVHHITNYVTVNDCANITLAIGASPIMADAIGEAADIAAISQAVVLNMGTLNERTVPSMIAAGLTAKSKGVPVIFDPVGAGASKLRNDTCQMIIQEIKPDVIRGNISEIRFVAGLSTQTKGVDASIADAAGTEQSEAFAKSTAAKLGCVIAITRSVDVVSDGKLTYLIENGNAGMSRITGSGCMCTSLVGSFCGANPASLLEACTCAIAVMGIAGEMASEAAENYGTSTFRTAIIDAVSRIDTATFEKRAKILISAK